MREVLMNEKTNLLQLEEHFYQLVDVDEPNTFRNLFPYSEVPKIAFNDRIVPHNMPEDIWELISSLLTLAKRTGTLFTSVSREDISSRRLHRGFVPAKRTLSL